MLIPAGRLADRYGRKRVFMIGLVGFAATSALCGLAPGTGVLITARALQASFSALVVPTSLALILPEFSAERRHVAVGTWGMMGAAAAATGPDHRCTADRVRLVALDLPGQRADLRAGRGIRSPGAARVPRPARRRRARPARHPAGRRDPGVAELRDHRGSGPRLVVALRRRGVRAGRDPAAGFPVAHVEGGAAGHGPLALRGASVPGRQRRDPGLRHGVLRHAARQCGLPTDRLALLGLAGRPGRGTEPVGRHGGRADGQQGRQPDRLPTRAGRRRPQLGGRVRRLRARRRSHVRTGCWTGCPGRCCSVWASG